MEEKINKILEINSGSILYGTSTPTSDTDFVGVFIGNEDTYFGLETIEEIDLSTHSKDETGKNTKEAVDKKLYELKNFLKLAIQNNPNILEIIFVNEPNIVHINDFGKELIANRHIFPWKGAKQKFLGYAFSQKHKMYIKRDNIAELKVAYEYLAGYIHDQDSANKLLAEFRELPNLYFFKFTTNNCMIGDLNFNVKLKIKDVRDKLQNRLDKGTNRSGLMEKYGYDCYHINTEFLTMDGWKQYDNIDDSDLLGTVNPITHLLEYQQPFERVKTNYAGVMYNYNGLYTNMVITPNHRMFVSPCHRSKKTNYSTTYDASKAKWEFKSAKELNDTRRSTYHILTSVSPNYNNFIDIDTDYLKLLGFFISEGSYNKISTKTGKHRAVRIVQTNYGKPSFFTEMDGITSKFKFRKYTYDKKRSKVTHETIWVSHDKNLLNLLYTDCGKSNKNKTIPKWIYKLSTPQALILLESLILGDGTERKHSYVYYTIYKEIADMIQILALITGKDCNVRNPYTYKSNFTGKDLTMYQVIIRKSVSTPKRFSFNTKIGKNKGKSKGGNEITYDGDIVCFTVPNELLITRLNGKIAIQGNTKFGSHLIRLMLEGVELLTTGELVFPLKYRELLLDIKNGKYSMEEVLKMSEDLETQVEGLAETSDLPSKPRYKDINKLSISMIKKSIL